MLRLTLNITSNWIHNLDSSILWSYQHKQFQMSCTNFTAVNKIDEYQMGDSTTRSMSTASKALSTPGRHSIPSADGITPAYTRDPSRRSSAFSEWCFLLWNLELGAIQGSHHICQSDLAWMRFRGFIWIWVWIEHDCLYICVRPNRQWVRIIQKKKQWDQIRDHGMN